MSFPQRLLVLEYTDASIGYGMKGEASHTRLSKTWPIAQPWHLNVWTAINVPELRWLNKLNWISGCTTAGWVVDIMKKMLLRKHKYHISNQMGFIQVRIYLNKFIKVENKELQNWKLKYQRSRLTKKKNGGGWQVIKW